MQVFFEVLMMAVFLWARMLASRAVPTDPSGEAKLLIWIIFLGDVRAQPVYPYSCMIDTVVFVVHAPLPCCRRCRCRRTLKWPLLTSSLGPPSFGCCCFLTSVGGMLASSRQYYRLKFVSQPALRVATARDKD